jgi:hypothetical protein
MEIREQFLLLEDPVKVTRSPAIFERVHPTYFIISPTYNLPVTKKCTL